jgi:hypothetical protein
MRIEKRVRTILKAEKEPFVSVEEFRAAIDAGEWFVGALKSGKINSWNFNYAMAGRDGWRMQYPVFAMLNENVAQFGGEVIDEYEDFSLVRQS